MSLPQGDDFMNKLHSKLNQLFEKTEDIYYDQSSQEGYWSNLNRDEQTVLLKYSQKEGTRNAVNKFFPRLYDIIFNPMRAVGLELLEIRDHEVGVDYGCMWGNLLIYCAKKCRYMLGVDQTRDSLEFVKYRLKEENIDNCYLLNANLRNNLHLKETLDFSIVNGVLEWIPDENEVELKMFLKKGKLRLMKPRFDPTFLQFEFLERVCRGLRPGGKLYLAIENRYDYQHFLWKKDVHSDLFYTTFLPRKIANVISNIWYGRPYVNYIYSRRELEKLIKRAGFETVETYAVFPDYRFPKKIIPYRENMQENFESVYGGRKTRNIVKKAFRKMRRSLDWLVYKRLSLFELAPSFIVVAKKGTKLDA